MQVRIYNNGLGEFFLPPPRDLPQHAREGLRGKLRIPAGCSVQVEEALWIKIALHKTVRPHVASGVLATRPLRVEKRKPSGKPSDEEVRRALARGGTPLDLYVGLVPDHALQRLAEGGRTQVAVAADVDDLARANAELAAANEIGSRQLTEARAEVRVKDEEIERLRAELERARASAQVVPAPVTPEEPAPIEPAADADATKDERPRRKK